MHALSLHPVIRLTGFFVLGGFIALGGFRQIIIASLLLAVVYALYRVAALPHPLPAAPPLRAMLTRMRWLFLSLLILYFWFTPGQPILSLSNANLQAYVPTLEGVEMGLTRVAALILLVLAVALLLRSTGRAQLVGALYCLSKPLAWLGIAPHKLALRLALILEIVGEAQQLLVQRAAAPLNTPPLERIAQAAAALFQQIIDRAERSPLQTVEIDEYCSVPARQWLYLLTLGLVLWWAA